MKTSFTITPITSSPSVYRAVRLDRFIPEKIRQLTLRVFLAAHIAALISVGFAFLFSWSGGPLFGSFFNTFDFTILWAFVFLSGSIALLFLFFEFFYCTSLRPSRIGRSGDTHFFLAFDASRIFFALGILGGRSRSFSSADLYVLLLKEYAFQLFLLRLGIKEKDFRSWLREHEDELHEKKISSQEFLSLLSVELQESDSETFGMKEIIQAAFSYDKDFVAFLFQRSVRKEEVQGVLVWIERNIRAGEEQARFWEKVRLGRTPGIAKDFGFGYTFLLDQHSYDIQGRESELLLESRKKQILLIEDVLSKSGEANVLLVGKEGTGRHIVLRSLASRIYRGIVPPAIEHKRLVYFDIDSITAFTKTKGRFEEAVLRMMEEAANAGNIILVIDDLAHAIASSFEVGSDFITLTESFFRGSHLQVIAISDPYSYHKVLEPNGKITAMFSRIDIEEPDKHEMISVIENVISLLERKSGAFFTYQGLMRLVEVADRYIQIGAMPEKAINLADEVASRASLEGVRIIGKNDVDIFASEKLKIPLGEAREEEKEKLLRLEDLLHERVINQEEAIRTIANTMRRARAGIRNQERPLGSFLFLGPTGVGKTQTAKALAEVYFGGTNRMVRFDMSEFKGEEGLRKFIGGFDSGEPGILSRQAHDNPFALYLFDELEKASRAVLDLFLQILEEGFFSDGKGERISMRETIIITTSNAGSGLIWKMVERGIDPAERKREVIDTIQSEGIFAPEFLNRFDGIVVYRPLSREHLYKVARLLLEDLEERLREKEIILEFSDALIRKVMEVGYDPQFGARPMRRAIADRVEAVIAKRMLGGSIHRGDTIRFSDEEIENL
ncbi:MAG: ATP-dependent Clp protease ATP-binding subunit [Candidatus Niyogibacteria bacterium]|nr:ATP-dependent Clp protease ATP-binding subunit [Candidatus Niyogibacteria bacterium]